ncbi:hypothetical protein TWF225_011239 [Orbilia oligospora]|nr:hypothetical protein TWF225_011239 [Orbilia oligospora]KAF3175925.1 hypothetical protein TWF751_003688 [Orbilia oligospora]KAF3247259.1 hypothetical protein TWF217_009670 [Orbilia oligospora]KAF3256274.1 hypothetical protein TWF128_005346 [Orbilia oligospora]KAF3280646.1 hypothetical protein TWF132_011723 [Orbilia oligospora]
MPPRKSDATKAAAAAAVSDPASTDDDKPKGRGRTNVDDNTLPKTIVTRLAKGNVPSNTQIQKDAVTALSRSATVFINYLASMANDITKMKDRKTIMPDHVIEAIDQIEFPGLRERLEGELKQFNKIQENKRKKAKEKKQGDTTADPMSEDESARPLKRQRKSVANQKEDEDDGVVTEGNILEDGSQEEEEEEEEGGDEEEGEEEGEESGEGGESGDEEPQDGMEDIIEDIDLDETGQEEDEALDYGSDSD